MAESAPSEQWNLVTLEIGAGLGVNASRIVLHITLLWSFNLHKHPVLSSETFRCLEFGTCRHSREIWFQIRRPANQIYNQAWLSEFLDFGFSEVPKTKFLIYTAAGSLISHSVYYSIHWGPLFLIFFCIHLQAIPSMAWYQSEWIFCRLGWWRVFNGGSEPLGSANFDAMLLDWAVSLRCATSGRFSRLYQLTRWW